MKYEVKFTTQFKKDVKLAKKCRRFYASALSVLLSVIIKLFLR